MRKFKGVIRTDKQGSECEFEFEVEDNATQEEIDKEGRESAFNYVQWYYEEA